MAENNQQTINEEAGLPDNFVPVDAPPIIPGSPISDGSSKYLQGSLPPQFQHDASFVGTGYASRTPNLSLMPLGIQGNPSSNAAVQSTSQRIVVDAIAAIPPVKPAAPSVGDGLIHGDTIWEIDPAYTWLRDDFLTVPASVGGSFTSQVSWSFIGSVNGNGLSGIPPHLGSIQIPSSNISSGVSFLVPTGLDSGFGMAQNAWAILERPSWKVVWNFSLLRGNQNAAAFSLAQTSFYIGLGNNPTGNTSVLANTNTPRPPFFLGLRFDTDTTAPSIADTTFVFEARDFVTSVFGRNNTQGTTFNTGDVPAEGVSYRLEIQGTSVGKALLTLFIDGASSVSTTLTMPVWVNSATFEVALAAQNGVGTVISTQGSSGNAYLTPFSVGSNLIIANATGGYAVLNGTQSCVIASSGRPNNAFEFFSSASLVQAFQSATTLSGLPALFPYVAFGNDTSATPTAGAKSVVIDFVSFVWNPGVGGGTGTPNINKSRYF